MKIQNSKKAIVMAAAISCSLAVVGVSFFGGEAQKTVATNSILKHSRPPISFGMVLLLNKLMELNMARLLLEPKPSADMMI